MIYYIWQACHVYKPKETSDFDDDMPFHCWSWCEAGPIGQASCFDWCVLQLFILYVSVSVSFRERLVRLRSQIKLKMVKKYTCKRTGRKRVVLCSENLGKCNTTGSMIWQKLKSIRWPLHLSFTINLWSYKAGGPDLAASSQYPIGLGLKVGELMQNALKKLGILELLEQLLISFECERSLNKYIFTNQPRTMVSHMILVF